MKHLALLLGLAIIAASCSSVEVPNAIQASHILVPYVGATRAPAHITRSKSEAKRQAKALAKQAKSGENFALLARRHSSCPSKMKGGSLGLFRQGQMVPSFEDAAWDLDIGETSGVVETQFGYHIIKRTR